MVQRNAIREAGGTWLMIVRALISWKVTPRNAGVSKILVTAPASKSGSAGPPGPRPGPAARSLRLAQRTMPTIEQLFDQGKHVFDQGDRFLAEIGRASCRERV